MSNNTIPIAIAGLYLVLQLVVNGVLGGYGIFRDELYYIANSQRLDWGYVDHPPLAPLLLAWTRSLFGESITVLRILPACAGAATVFFASLIARQMGGQPGSQIIAALAVVAVPVYAVMFGFYSMNAYEILLWATVAYIITTLLTEEHPKYWLVLGVLVGIGLQNKHTFLLFAAGFLLGLLLHNRSAFKNKWLWLGGGLSFLILLPNLLWQAQHSWPSLEFYSGAAGKNITTDPVNVVLDQLLAMNPALFALWLMGLIWLSLNTRLRPLAWSYLLPLFVLILAGSSRPDRMAAAYIPLFAAGAVCIEQLARRLHWKWLPAATGATVLTGALVVAPLGLPFLSPETTSAYSANFGMGSYEEGVVAELPQYFADRFGWQELAASVAEVYHLLTAEEQAQAAVFTSNYGQAGAIALFGHHYGLPEPISGHNSYWLWGPADWSGELAIVVNIPENSLNQFFDSVETMAWTSCRFCVEYENNAPISVVRGAKLSLSEMWPLIKNYQ